MFHAVSLDEVMAHKEDDDESDHVICIDSKDADDAAQVIGRLIESHSKQRKDAVQAAGQPSVCDLELWQEIAPVLADFNREIDEEAHGRKERFRTQRLIKNREQLMGEAVDEELDFLEEDDNIVAVFEHEDGSLYWVVGSIQYICTAAADIDIRKISDGDLQVRCCPRSLIVAAARSCMPRAHRRIGVAHSGSTSRITSVSASTTRAPSFSWRGMWRWTSTARTCPATKIVRALATGCPCWTTRSPTAGYPTTR